MSRLKLEGELSLDGSGWDRTLNKAERGINHLAKDTLGSLKSAFIGAFAIGTVTAAFEEAVKSSIEFASQTNDTSKRLGISTDAVQEFGFAAKQSGVEIGQIATSLDHLAKGMVTIEQGGEAADKLKDSLSKVGVSVEELKGKSPEQLFKLIGERMESIPDGAELSAASMELFGDKLGTKLIPVLKELRLNIKRFKDGGLGVSDKDLDSLDAAGKAYDKLKDKIKAGTSHLLVDPLGAAADLGMNSKLIGMGQVRSLYKEIEAIVTATERGEAVAAERNISAMEKILAQHQNLNDMLKERAKRTEVDATTRTPEQIKAMENDESKLREDTASRQEKRRLSRMDNPERIKESEDKIKGYQSQLDKLDAKDPSNSYFIQRMRNQIEVEKDTLDALQKENLDQVFGKTDKGAKLSGMGVHTPDSLVSTGNFLGESARNIPAIQEKLIDAHKNSVTGMQDLTAALAALTRAMGGGTMGESSLGGFA